MKDLIKRKTRYTIRRAKQKNREYIKGMVELMRGEKKTKCG